MGHYTKEKQAPHVALGGIITFHFYLRNSQCQCGVILMNYLAIQLKIKFHMKINGFLGFFYPPLLCLSIATLLVELLPFVGSPSGNIIKKLWIPRSQFF